MIYKLFYWAMVIGYLYCSFDAISLRIKIIGILLTIVNAILFWK